ncbi:head decoration protein [Streptomyces chartreusis]
MSIQPVSRSATYSANRDWLASLHGTDQTETITLDLSKFTANTHYFASTDTDQPYSRVVSGIPVAKITASGLFAPWNPAASDGTQVLAGLVFAEALFAPGVTKDPGRAAVARRRQGVQGARRHRHHQGHLVTDRCADPVRVR